jgi:hypothetical protein
LNIAMPADAQCRYAQYCARHGRDQHRRDIKTCAIGRKQHQQAADCAAHNAAERNPGPCTVHHVGFLQDTALGQVADQHARAGQTADLGDFDSRAQQVLHGLLGSLDIGQGEVKGVSHPG